MVTADCEMTCMATEINDMCRITIVSNSAFKTITTENNETLEKIRDTLEFVSNREQEIYDSGTLKKLTIYLSKYNSVIGIIET